VYGICDQKIHDVRPGSARTGQTGQTMVLTPSQRTRLLVKLRHADAAPRVALDRLEARTIRRHRRAGAPLGALATIMARQVDELFGRAMLPTVLAHHGKMTWAEVLGELRGEVVAMLRGAGIASAPEWDEARRGGKRRRRRPQCYTPPAGPAGRWSTRHGRR
jgi:hypothetical protein